MSFLKYAERNPDGAQRKLERAGNRVAALRARGICTHGWIQGTPGDDNGPAKCLHCGQQFANTQAAWEAGRDVMNNA